MDNYNLEEIKRIPITDIATRLGIKYDRNNKTLCFKHDEKTPSLILNKKTNHWKCFGCGATGSNIDLVMAYIPCEFKQACDWISKNFGINITGSTQSKKTLPIKKQYKEILKKDFIVENIVHVDSEVFSWLIENLNLSDEAYQYLNKQRKIPSEYISEFNFRDIKFPEQTFKILIEKWGVDRLLNCGLLKKDKNGNVKFVWWDHVIIIPYYNESGELTYLQGRRFADNKPKYINLNGLKTEIFNSKILGSLASKSKICICEGAFDAISANVNNVTAIGIIGASGFKKEWVYRLRNFEIFVAPDNDEAGKNFAKSISIMFKEIGKQVQIVKLPDSVKDVSEFFENKLSIK